MITCTTGNLERLVGEPVAIEPDALMICLRDCPMSRGGAGEEACDRGPLVYGRVVGVSSPEDESESGLGSLLVERLGYVCTRGGDIRFIAEQDLGPAVLEPKAG